MWIEMARETEIKLRITNLAGFRRALRKLGARSVARVGGRVHEQNVLFDTAAKQLKNRGQLLRIRTEAPAARGKGGKHTQRVLLTFKRPVAAGEKREESRGAHKVREELELQVSDGEALASIFRGLGMRPWFSYEKFRTTYRLPKGQRWAKGLLIELDETPIGTLVELEGPSRAIDRAAKTLGFSKQDYVVANYFVLYRDECRRRGEKPGDMLFAKKNRRL
jgi:adenylate cyclase class 2